MSTSEAPKPVTVPTVMGGLEEEYEILRELGRGGTAVVYLARDRSLGREVAIKVIRATYVEDEEAVARLVREARTVGQLQHPNIVMLYGTHRLDDNSLALIMQYVPGRPLKELIRSEGPLPFKMAGAVLDDIASALSYAHRQKIVHRDIKPENIYLDEGVEVARLADFGIARHWDNDAGITLPGMAIGTPTYMSPEQIDGANLDGRSDIYSLGIVGYEMLTGQQPWAGENLYSIIYKQKREQLPRLDEVRPGIPEDLRAAVEGALKKRPEERWQSPEQFLACLRGVVEEETVVDIGAAAAGGATAAAEVAGPGGSTALEPDGPVIDEHAMTIRYRRPTEEELEAAVGDEGEEDEDDQYEDDEYAYDEDMDDLGALVHPDSHVPPDRRRLVGMGLIAFAAAAVGFVAFQGISEGTTGLPETPPGGGVAEGPPAGGTEPVATGAPVPGGGRPARMELASDEPLVGAPGEATASPLRVRLFRDDGSPASGALVEFSVASGGGRVSPRMVAADENGVAQATWTLGVAPGGDLVEVKTPAAGDVPTLTVTASRTGAGAVAQNPSGGPDGSPDPPGSPDTTGDPAVGGGAVPTQGAAIISAVAGTGQVAAPGSSLGTPVRIMVLGSDGEPAPGVTVVFEPDPGHGTASIPTTETDEEGFAQTGWTLGSSPGIMRMRARVAGQQDLAVAVEASAVAVAASALRTAALVVSGGTHTCASSSSGTVSCWGGNTSGQLGDGGRTRRSRPTVVPGNLAFARLAAGFSSTCGITSEGDTYCWGGNAFGELGDGSTTARVSPSRVAGGRTFVDLDLGSSHACGRTASGQTFCWGLNDSGQLGDGSTVSRTAPTPVGARRFRSISTGWNHTCGISGAQSYCWGANDSGQLGAGTTTPASQPTAVAVTFAFEQLDAGGTHTCGVSSSGIAYCWGANNFGQLGDGSGQGQSSPVPVDAGVALEFVAAGPTHTCGLTAAGAAYCWGRNNQGQLGDGTANDRGVPTPVVGGVSFTRLTVSGNHTCGRATDGTIYCWGYNSDGQLGDGTRQSRSRPAPVGG